MRLTKGLEQVAAYLASVIDFNSDPSAHVKATRDFLERLSKHNLKLSPSQLGST